jgi:hypothetical protein
MQSLKKGRGAGKWFSFLSAPEPCIHLDILYLYAGKKYIRNLLAENSQGFARIF